jgi:hypothetical protein
MAILLRRDLQAGTVASPIGGPQTALVANNTGVVVVRGDRSRFEGRVTENQTFRPATPQVAPAGQTRLQPNQQGIQAPFFPALTPPNASLKTDSFVRGKGNVLGQ